MRSEVTRIRRWHRLLQRKKILRSRRVYHRGGWSYSPPKIVERYIVKPPELCSVSERFDEFVGSLEELKKATLIDERKNVRYDLARVKELRPAAALVLAAELDRWRILKRKRLVPSPLGAWHAQPRRQMLQLGVFDLLHVKKRELRSVRKQENSAVILKYRTGDVNNKNETDALIKETIQRYRKRRQLQIHGPDRSYDLDAALAEATLNSVQHAYSHGKTRYEHLENRFWMGAVFDDNSETMRFMVYDQGIGIAHTLKNTTKGIRILSIMANFFGNLIDDDGKFPEGELIKLALTTPATSTGLENRGKGLPEIYKAAQNLGASFRIVSGRGIVSYSSDTGLVAKPDRKHHLGGTLLEWALKTEKS